MGFVLLVTPAAGRAAEAAPFETPKTGCAHCQNENSEIPQLLRSADRFYEQFKPRETVSELLKVLKLDPRHFEALGKLARAYIDIGDMIPETAADWQERRIKQYRVAEEYARKAVAVNPNSTWSHFYVAWSLGNIALVSPVGAQIDLANEIRGWIEKAIALDPQNGYAYHIYGVWQRRMSEIGKMSRMLASVFYGRSVPEGSMEKALEYLRKAVALNPTVIVSRLELGKTYIVTENWAQARTSLKSVEELPIKFSDDHNHKQKARQLLEEIKDR